MEACEVTVYCTVYNHEKYVGKCLESFINQKTSFRFSVIVHDDASTDRSTEIIREYAAKYPDIIVPIYQTENQYQQNVNIIDRFIEPIVKSKYIAICEGDDYWSSPEKLQKQYDAMEQHPECGICLHRTLEVTEEEAFTGVEYPEAVYETGLISARQLFATFPVRIYHTSSYFMRAEYWHQYIQDSPAYRRSCNVGDIPILLYFGSHYGVYQINEALSCYRRGAESSWSFSRFQVNEKNLVNYHLWTANTFRLFDRDTQGLYHDFCVERISKHLYAKCALSRSMKEFFLPENRGCFKALSPVKKATVLAGVVFPSQIKRVYVDHTQKKIKQERARW